jgi:hypothetical protein
MTALAYLSGVINGDGWEGDNGIGMKVKDRDFAETFAIAVEVTTGRMVRPRLDGGYWKVVVSARDSRLEGLRAREPDGAAETAAWLRGLFDSEGNAQLTRAKRYPDSWHRRVAFYSTCLSTLHRAKQYLAGHGIEAHIRQTRNSTGHKGALIVHELKLTCSADNFARFTWTVGSSLARKQEALRRIVMSYKTDFGKAMRAAQAVGAASKKKRTMEVTLPRVVEGIRALIASGKKPTQRACRPIEGYGTIQRYVKQADLVRMAST